MISAASLYRAYCHPSRGDAMPLVMLAIIYVIAPFAIAFGAFTDALILDTRPPVVAELRVP